MPLFLDFLVAASFDEFTDLLGDLLAKFDEGDTSVVTLPTQKKLTMDMLAARKNFPRGKSVN